jgi:IPT/TIG domain/Putative Ig domain
MIIMSFALTCLINCAGGGGVAPHSPAEPRVTSTLEITAGTLPVGALHQNYQATVFVTGGVPPYTWVLVDGALPPGLSLSPSSGAIAGKPSEAGSFSFRAQIDDAHADTVSGGLSINVSTEQAPAVTTVSPNTGSSEGGTRVTIRGSDFQPGASVRFGGSPGTSVSVDTTDEIQVTTPAEAAGSVSVTVQNADGALATDQNAFVFESSSKSNGPTLPTLPQAFVDTSYPDTTGYTVVNVPPGSLQMALKSASCSPNGTILQLPRGSVDKEIITLPQKACASDKWIIITTAGVSLPAQGTRLDPSAFVGQIARLTQSASGESTIQTQHNSPVNHYWLAGLEIEQTAPIVYMTIDIGTYAATPDQLPSNIVIDRCYVHGKATNDVQRDILLNGSNLAVVDSYVSEGHWAGVDAQAISTWNGSGPLKITNNFLEGSGENVLIGGAVALPELVPSDIEIRSNYFHKSLSWRKADPSYGGIPWTVKNLLEFKNAQRVLVDGNIFENNWTMAQTGTAVLFTPRAEFGKMPWDVVQDITFTHNLVQHAAGAFDMLGIDDTDKTTTGIVRMRRALIKDNLLLDISKTNWTGYGALFELLSGVNSITIDHNTGFSDHFFALADGVPSSKLVFTNNIVERGEAGFVGSGTAEGTAALTKFAPAAVFSYNVIVGGNSSLYPAGNLFPGSIPALQLVNYGGPDSSDYALCQAKLTPAASCASASPISMGQPKACQNNTNCGADIANLGKAIANAAVMPANLPSINSLSPNATVCNGTNTVTMEGSNLNLQGVEVIVNGKLVSPSNVTADSLTFTPPQAAGVVPVMVDDFGISSTKPLTCQ